MTECFADSFYWIALLNADDAYHERVKKAILSPRLVTTWAVQLEVMDAFCEERLRPLAMAFWQKTTSNPDLIVVPLDVAMLHRGVELFGKRPDKNWSLTDCISFTVMQERSITEALTADQHFQQAGFRALLRE